MPQIEEESAPIVSSRQPERLADLADRRAAAVGNHGRGDAGALAAIAAIDVLDHLLAPLVLEVDVDVRRLVAVGGDEALEQQIVQAGIDLGDAEAKAHRRVRRRAATLAENILRARIADDVVDGEEIGRVAQLGDQCELMLEVLAHFVRDAPGIARGSAFPCQTDERVLWGGKPCARLVGIFVAQLVEREGERGSSLAVSSSASGTS